MKRKRIFKADCAKCKRARAKLKSLFYKTKDNDTILKNQSGKSHGSKTDS